MSGFDPDAFLAQPTEAPQPQQPSQPQAANQADASGFDPDAFLKQQNANDYSSTGQKIKAGLEGVAEGIAGPLAPFAEKRYLGVDPEDIRGREEAHPYIHGAGQIAGLLAPTGEGALLSKAGESVKGLIGATKEAPLAARLGQSAAAHAAEFGLFQGGDEISKMIKEDPNASAQNAIANISLAAALGGAGGTALGAVSPLWKATVGSKLGQVLEDLKGRVNFRINNPDLPEAFHNELSQEYNILKGMTRGIFGDSGIKQEALQKVIPDMSEAITKQASDVSSRVEDSVSKLMEEGDPHAKILQRDLARYQGALNKPDVSSMDVFKATEDLKQQLQEYGKFNKDLVPLAERNFRNTAKELSHDLRLHLEDQDVWGKAGELQKDLNAAIFKHIPALKDFESKFTQKLATGRVMDPAKTNTYINQLGKSGGKLRQKVMKDFLNTSDNMRNEVSKIYSKLGVESPVEKSSLSVINDTLGTPTLGSKLADKLIDHGVADAAGAGVGAAAGSTIGHPYFGMLVGEHALSPMFRSVLPGIIKSVLENKSSPQGYKAAIDYGMNVAKGEAALSKASKNVFKPGAEVVAAKAWPDEKDRQKLDKIITAAQNNPQNLMNAQTNSHIGHYLGDHQTAVTQTTTQAAQYLQQLKPQPYKPGPLDKPIAPSKIQEARYNRALDIASNPSIILQHVKDGTLQISDLQDLKSMFPSYYNNISQKLTNEMMSKESEEEHIPYKTRIGVSMFLGQPMDSSMNPMSIMAAQPVPKASPPQPEAQKKGSPSKMKDKSAKAYETSTQSAEADRSGRKA